MPTYRLETFGKLTLSGSSSDLSHQRRRLALLALLAASGDRGLTRDQLLSYLWSERAAGNARHSLEQLVHTLRRSLGESVFDGTNPMRLAPDVVASDVTEFEQALALGSFADAVALYRGPFLGGFYLDDAPEFERWTTAERARLAGRYEEALSRLAGDAEAAGDHAAAVRWRRMLADADPVGSRSALALMRALVAAGDRTAALQHARIYEALVRQELDANPDPSIAKYAATLRAAADQVTPSTGAPPNQPARVSAAAVPLAMAPVMEESVPREGSVPREPAGAGEPLTGDVIIRRRNYVLPAAILIGATILFIAVWSLNERRKGPTPDQNKIVIVPFRISGGDSTVMYLGEGVVDLMAPMLTGEGGPSAIDSRTAISTWNRITSGRDGTAADARQVAREVGAGLVLSGAIVEVDGKLTITGNIISDAGDVRPLASVSTPIDSVDKLVRDFVGQLLASQSGLAESSRSAVTSQSTPAIRAYLNGRAAYRRSDEDRAIESFTRALDIDSTFALAALDLAVATGKVLRAQICRNNACRVFSIVPGFASSERMDDLFDRAVRVAWANRARLGRRDRPLLDALRGDSYPRATSARETLVALDRAIAAAPDRPETHYLLGLLLMYQGPALALSASRQNAEAAFRRASRLDSTYLAPLARLVDVAAFEGDTAKLRSAGVLYLARDTVTPTADYIRWLVAVGTRDVPAHDAIRARFRSLSSPVLDQIFLTGQLTGLGLEDADSAAIIIADSASNPIEKSVALRRGNMLALNRGRPAEATRLLRQMNEMRSASYTFRMFAIDAGMFADGDRALEDSSARDLAQSLARDTLRPLSADGVRQASVALATLSLWYLENGEPARAAAAADWLRRHSAAESRNRVLAILPQMLIASRARNPEGVALRAYVDSIALDGCCEFPPFGSLTLARAYEASGDETSALRVIRRGIWFYPPRLLSTHLREEGRLAAQLGDRAGAIRAWDNYLALRSNPEPAFVAQRDSIRAQLDRLRRGG